MSGENDLQVASAAFYAALNSMLNGDAGPLSDVWSHGDAVSSMHPVGGCEIGWATVSETWAKVAQVCTDGDVALEDQFLQVSGDTAYELGVERGSFTLAGQPVAVDGRVTNIYRREAGAWKMVHHHADLSPAMVAALQKLSG